MDEERSVRTSRLLSLALRHRPRALDLTLDHAGWAGVEEVLRGLARHGEPCSREELVWLVGASPKQRFALSADGARIRANQGHSVEIELGLAPIEPPPTLFHGTSQAALSAIRREGLVRGARNHVHLSVDEETATLVAKRRAGPHVILTVRALDLHHRGQAFYRSDNGVWLTAHVPPEFLLPD